MAKTDAKPQPVAPAPPPPEKRNFPWITVGIIAVVLCFLLMMTVLHMSGALRAPEEAIYSATKGVPVVSFFTRPLHHENWKEKLTPEQAIDVKNLQSKLIRSEGEVESLKEAIAQMSSLAADVAATADDIKKMKKDISDLKTGEIGAGPSGSTVGMSGSAPSSMPPAIISPSTASITPITGTGENYRLVAKIFEKLPADTAVDILNNLSDMEKVKILSQMKEKTVADIIAAFDPIKSAELTRMLAKSSGS